MAFFTSFFNLTRKSVKKALHDPLLPVPVFLSIISWLQVMMKNTGKQQEWAIIEKSEMKATKMFIVPKKKDDNKSKSKDETE